jgi:hypothetical protein
MKQQTDTASPAASPAESRTTSPACSADISPLAAFGLPVGIRTTAAYSAYPATFTEAENSGYLAALSNVKSRDELMQLCSERSTTERTRWQSWWTWHECLKRVQEFSPVANEWYIRPEDQDELKQLRSERLTLLVEHRQWKDQHALDRKVRQVTGRLYELTGHHAFKPR